jgi:hypothetical protein
VTLAQQGVEVTVLEAAETIFGGTCTREKDPNRLDFLEARRGTDIFAATAPDLGRVQRVSGLVSEHGFIGRRRRHRGHSYASTGSLIHSVSSRRPSSSASATSIDGSGPPRSRAAEGD